MFNLDSYKIIAIEPNGDKTFKIKFEIDLGEKYDGKGILEIPRASLKITDIQPLNYEYWHTILPEKKPVKR